MEKPQLINFIAKVMEESGFKVYKNFKTSQNVIDIYAVLPTNFGDFGVVVECNNYDKDFPVSIDIIKHMEKIAESIKASKIVIVSSSFFTEQAINYALKKNVKLVDRNDLLSLVKRHQNKNEYSEEQDSGDEYYQDEYYDDPYYYEGDPYYREEPYAKTGTLDDYYQDSYSEGPYYQDHYVEVTEPYYDDYEYDEYEYDEGYGDYDYDYDEYVIAQRESNPVIYQPSLYKHDYYEDESTFGSRISEFFEKILKRKSSNVPQNSLGNYAYYDRKPSKGFLEIIKPHLGNPLVLIALVVIITYIISFIGGSILKVDHTIISAFQIFFSLVLAYGFTYLFADRSMRFVIRGTFVFFVSLIILIVLILI